MYVELSIDIIIIIVLYVYIYIYYYYYYYYYSIIVIIINNRFHTRYEGLSDKWKTAAWRGLRHQNGGGGEATQQRPFLGGWLLAGAL